MPSKLQDYASLSSVIFGRPIAVEPSYLRGIQQASVDVQAFLDFMSEFGPAMAQEEESPIAVIKVRGTLYRGMFFDDYDDIQALFDRAMTDASVSGILLDVDSPGGQVSGMFDLAEHILEARGDKPIWAYANDQMTSAAYALGSAADRVIASTTAVIGSIGVLAMHVDRSEMERDAGVRYTEIASGRQKTALSPHKPLSKDGREQLQALVDQGMDIFADYVARSRNMSSDAVRDLDAGTFTAQGAIDQGLADSISNFDDIVAELSEVRTSSTSTGATGASRATKPMAVSAKETEVDPKDKKEEGTTEPTAEVVDINEARDEVDRKARAEAKAEAKVRVDDINRLCAVSGMQQLAGDFIAGELSMEDIGKEILKAKAEADEADPTTNGAHDASGDEEPVAKCDPMKIYGDRQAVVDRYREGAK